MDFDSALKYLQSQFSGSMVLYVDDIATILGKSKKAASHLASRNELPFKIKKVGGLRCVDIFQVAQWFADDGEVAEEATQVAPAALAIEAKAKGVRMTPSVPTRGKRRVQSQDLAEHDESAFGFMALNILKERKAQMLSLQRFVCGLSDSTEKAFMGDVVEKMFFSERLLPTCYGVTLKRLAPQHFKVRGDVRTKYFEAKEDALDYLVVILVKAKCSVGNFVTHLTMEQSGKTIFHAISSKSDRMVLENNEVGLDLPGM